MLIKKCQTNNKPMFYVPITLTTLYDQPSIEFIHSSQFLSNTEEMKPTLIKPVPPSNPKYNTAVQVRSQRSANRFSASGEKRSFSTPIKSPISIVLRIVLKKKEKQCLHSSLTPETLTSPQSLSISQT